MLFVRFFYINYIIILKWNIGKWDIGNRRDTKSNDRNKFEVTWITKMDK